VGIVLIPIQAIAQWAQTSGPYGGPIFAFMNKGNRIYAGTDGGGVFYSTNSGITWARSDFGVPVRQVHALADQGTSIFAGTNIGIFRSDNDGLTWQLTNGDKPEAKVTAIGGIGRYVLAWFDSIGVCRSSDDGGSWLVVLDDQDPYRPADAIVTIDSLVFLGWSQGCYVSADSGLTWEARNNGMDRVGAALSFVERDGIVLAGTNKSLFRSSDYGANWEERATGLPPEPASVEALLSLGVNFYAGTNAGVFQSVNNGDLWLPVSSGLDDPDIIALAVSGSALLAGSNAGVYRSVDNGAFWEESNEGLKSTRIRSILVRGPYVFAATRASGVYRTSDEGQTWDPVNDGLTNRRVSSLVQTESHLIAGTNGSGVFRSSDFGESWNPVTLPPSSPSITAMDVRGPLVYAGTDQGFCVSDDDGDTWTCNTLDMGVISALTASGSFLFAGTVDSGLYRSSNNGVEWEKIDPFFTTDTTIFSLAVSTPYVFAGTYTRGIFRSSDNGESWQPANVGMMDTTVSAILVTNDRLFIGTYGEGAFFSTNNGDSWEVWNDNLQKKELLSLQLVGSTIYGGTAGWGVEIREVPPSAPELSSPRDASVEIPVPVSLSWTSSPGAASYDVQICVNGDFDSLAVDESGVTETSLDQLDIARNTRYYWRVRASGSGGKGIFSPVWTFTTTAEAVFFNEPIHEFPPVPLVSTDYRLVSIPGSSGRTFASVLSGVQGVDWNVYEDTGGDAPNHLSEVHPDSLFEQGKGYWAIAKGLLDFSGTVTMPALDENGNCLIAVRDGWNIIANPFNVPVTTAAIDAMNAGSSSEYWTYEGIEQWADSSTLLPFKGYYFKNESGLDFLVFPYPFPARPSYQPVEPPILWKMRVELETNWGNDRQNYIGVSPEASDGADFLDKSKPFGPGSGPYLTFTNNAGTDEAIAADFRPGLGEGQIWHFDVVNPLGGESTLRFSRVTGFPSEVNVVLVNTVTDERVDVLADSTYRFTGKSERTPFMLLVGPPEFAGDYIEESIPEEFLLSQNYPNPFNPETVLKVSIPHESDVRLAIFSILGEETTVLASGRFGPGRYAFLWDGTDRSKNHVASGVYLARLVIDGTPMFVRKMLLLR
jgi:photosystem II stability/assembly factor-like uncharacterized protein